MEKKTKKMLIWLYLVLATIFVFSSLVFIVAGINGGFLGVKSYQIGFNWKEIKISQGFRLSPIDGPVQIRLLNGKQYLQYPDEDIARRLHIFEDSNGSLIPVLDAQEELSENLGPQIWVKSWNGKKIRLKVLPKIGHIGYN